MSWNKKTKPTSDVEFLVTQALDFLMTQDGDYLITNQSNIWNNLTKPLGGGWSLKAKPSI